MEFKGMIRFFASQRLIYTMPSKPQTVTEKPLLLTIPQAGSFLGVSRSSIYRLIDQGKLQVVRPLPDAPRIARAQIEDYADQLRKS